MTTTQAFGRDQQLKRLCWLLDTMIELLEGAQPENALGGIEQYEIEAAELIETTGLADEAEIRAEFRPVLKRTLLGWEEFGMEEFVGSAASHEKHATYVNYQFTESGGMFHSRKFDALTADGLALPEFDPPPKGWKKVTPPPGSWAEKLQQQLASCRRKPPLPDPDVSFVQTLVMCLQGWLRRAQWKATGGVKEATADRERFAPIEDDLQILLLLEKAVAVVEVGKIGDRLPNSHPLGSKAIGLRLVELEKAGMVRYPHGVKKGVTITDKGRLLLKSVRESDA